MPPVPEDEFETSFRSLPAAERTEFVADLWAARGRETTLEDGVVVAEQGDEQRRIRVVDPGRFGTPDVSDVDTLVSARDRDAVRAAANEAGVEYVSPTDLHDLLLYGVDREVARDLYEERFDQPLERAPPSDDVGGEKESGEAGVLAAALPSLADTGPSLSGNRRAVVALVLLALVGVAVAGPALSDGGASNQSPITVSDVTPDDESAGAIGAASPSPSATPRVLPGVTRAGVVEPQALVEAHVASVQNRSRVRSIRMTGPPNTSIMGGAVERNMTTRIVNDSRYRHQSSAVYAGENERRGGVGVYADGEAVFQRVTVGNDTRYSRYSVSERPASQYDDVGSYLYRYFAGADNTVVRCAIDYDSDCPTYRIEVDDDPPATLKGNVDDYEAFAIVSENGVITTVRASYTLPDDDGDDEREPVSFALDYRFKEVDVTAPDWLPAAKNETGAVNETATVTPTPTNQPN